MYICIEGNIGAGKTTFAKHFAKKYNALVLQERFEKTPLLPLFYLNKKQMSFLLEYSFLIDRYAQLKAHFKKHTSKITIADFSIYKSLWFAKTNLSKKEYVFYKKQFHLLENTIQKPSVIFFISTNTPLLLKNIKERGRVYEKKIGKGYLNQITGNYKKGLSKLTETPVVEISIKNYNKTISEKVSKFMYQYISSNAVFKNKIVSID